MRPQARPFEPEAGTVTLTVLVMMLGFAAMLGLMVDGNGRLNARERADAIAQQAARAGGQAIDPGSAVSGQRIYVTPQSAAAAAQAYLHAEHMTGTVTVSANGETVTVNLTTTYTPLFLSAFGFGPWQVPGEGSADLVAGVTGP
jgi:hypothetical protein